MAITMVPVNLFVMFLHCAPKKWTAKPRDSGPQEIKVFSCCIQSSILFNYLSIDMLAKNVSSIIPSYMVSRIILFPCNRMWNESPTCDRFLALVQVQLSLNPSLLLYFLPVCLGRMFCSLGKLLIMLNRCDAEWHSFCAQFYSHLFLIVTLSKNSGLQNNTNFVQLPNSYPAAFVSPHHG